MVPDQLWEEVGISGVYLKGAEGPEMLGKVAPAFGEAGYDGEF